MALAHQKISPKFMREQANVLRESANEIDEALNAATAVAPVQTGV